MQFDPTFTTLFDTVEQGADTASLLEAARLAHADERARFEHMLSGLKRIPAAVEAIEKIRLGFDRRLEGLALLECADVEPFDALLAIEQGQAALTRFVPALLQIDARARFSPFPQMNDFIQAGLNVAAGHDPAQALEERLPAVVAMVVGLERDWLGLIEVSDVAREQNARFVPLADRLREGVGAVRLWLDGTAQGRSVPSDLKIGLHLLGEASYALHALSEEVGAAVPPQLPAAIEMERLARRLSAGALEDEPVLEAFGRLESAIDELGAELHAFEAAFLPESLKAAFVPRLSEILGIIAHALDEVRHDSAALAPLREAIQAYQALFDARLEAARQAVPDLHGSPRFDQMRETVAGAYHGTVPTMYLRTLVDAFAHSLDEVTSAALAAEAEQIAAAHLEGLELLRGALATGHRALLAEGWFTIQDAVVRSLEMARAVEAQEQAAQRAILCLRCGRENPAGTSHCSHCAAFIPFSRAEAVQGSALAWSEEAGARSPAHVARLEALLHTWRTDRHVPPDLPPFVDALLASAAAALQEVTPTSAEHREAVEQFLAHTAAFEAGLREIQAALLCDAVASAEHGLGAVRAAAEGLAPLQAAATR